MHSVGPACDVVSGLISRWHAGSIRDTDREPYEEHLLCCPPCLAQNDKARAALAALQDVPTTPAAEDLTARLVQQVEHQAARPGR